MTTAASCCTRMPIGASEPVQVQKIANIDTYATGNKESKAGIVVIYDIFGFYPQTLHGAKLLADQTGAVTFVPDFLEGNYAQHSWFPPDTEEKKAQFGALLTNHAAPPLVLPKVNAWLKEAKAAYPKVEKWAAVGLCWGGKITVLLSGEGTEFAVTGQVHPGLYDAADAKKTVIPHVVLASKDEAAETTEQYDAIFKGEKSHLGSYVDTYSTMHHGWMGARADLEKDEDNKKEFARGYAEIAAFFKKHL